MESRSTSNNPHTITPKRSFAFFTKGRLMDWYYYKGGKRLGPEPLDILGEMARQGELTSSTLVENAMGRRLALAEILPRTELLPQTDANSAEPPTSPILDAAARRPDDGATELGTLDGDSVDLFSVDSIDATTKASLDDASLDSPNSDALDAMTLDDFDAFVDRVAAAPQTVLTAGQGALPIERIEEDALAIEQEELPSETSTEQPKPIETDEIKTSTEKEKDDSNAPKKKTKIDLTVTIRPRRAERKIPDDEETPSRNETYESQDSIEFNDASFVKPTPQPAQSPGSRENSVRVAQEAVDDAFRSPFVPAKQGAAQSAVTSGKTQTKGNATGGETGNIDGKVDKSGSFGFAAVMWLLVFPGLASWFFSGVLFSYAFVAGCVFFVVTQMKSSRGQKSRYLVDAALWLVIFPAILVFFFNGQTFPAVFVGLIIFIINCKIRGQKS